MAKKKEKKGRAEQNIHAVEEALSKTELFIEQNQKYISIVVGIIIVIVLAFFAYKKLYVAPKQKEAQAQMFMAEKYFEQDSLNLALYGDGNYLGFLDIIDEYKLTRSGNLAKYYAGISYLHLGEFETAIDYLKDFEKDDIMLSSMAKGAIGDAYIELEDPEKAVDYYMDAAEDNPNEFTSPLFLLKAGNIYEYLNQYDKALACYQKIKEEYGSSAEGRFIEKYIYRVKGYLGEL